MKMQIWVWFVVLSVCSLSGRCAAQPSDPNFKVFERHSGDRVVLIVNLIHISEATVSFSTTVQNMSSNLELNPTLELTGEGDHVIMTLTPIDPRLKSKFDWKWKFWIGHKMTGAPREYLYAYPGPHDKLIQGPRGSFTHSAGGPNAEAYDWAMPVGSVISAARAGTVVAVRDDSDLGGEDPKFSAAANYVIVRHNDGTYAEYVHLKHKGVLVHLGDEVKVGDGIALSGATGQVTEPHLHFAVYYTIDGAKRKSVPLRFSNPYGVR